MNVLVVDPDPQLAEQVRRLLADQTSVTIEAAATGTDAWMILGNFRHRFDVVLLDLGLPDIDGIELLTRMRASVKHRDVAVLVCSAVPHRDLVVKVVALGVRQFLVKPATDPVLRAKLADMTGVRFSAACAS
jgi:DNA-binding response OmpR family regulator